jgi:methylmalonyl-CoA mutase cobalamin-binding domain/chain
MADIKNLIETGKIKKIEEAVQEALDSGVQAMDILDEMTSAMDEVGAKFQRNEVFVPEMLVAAKTMQRGIRVIKPLLGGDEASKHGKFIIGTIAGYLHDIGKNLVAMMLESVGFEVIDLGVDVSAEQFVEAVKENPDCKLVGLSALLTTTMESMAVIVKALIDAGLKDQVKIMVGGAPISEEFAADIGADIYTTDAGSAAAKAKELVG